VTSSYGDAQGFRVTEIAGLESWESTGGTAGVTSDRNTSPARSPWD